MRTRPVFPNLITYNFTGFKEFKSFIQRKLLSLYAKQQNLIKPTMVLHIAILGLKQHNNNCCAIFNKNYSRTIFIL